MCSGREKGAYNKYYEPNYRTATMARVRPEPRYACYGFFGSVAGVSLLFNIVREPYCFFLSPCVAILSVIVQEKFLRKSVSEITIRSTLLGNLFGFGVWIALFVTPVRPFGLYMALLAHFHWSEYLFISLFSPRSLSIRSFMLDHSAAYAFATVASWAEYAAWYVVFPGMRNYMVISWIGLLICLTGEFIRKAAISTARENFDHIVEDSKRPEHVLITHGIYRLCRHPSYLGWWMFAVGTQAVLQNPVCVIGFFYGAYRFFANRVPYEEYLLVRFFGDQYIQYRRRVPLLLPFIKDPARMD